jgi:hypothetical protein
MNFAGSRLGFWFRPADRGLKSKRVLVFYDPLTNMPFNSEYRYNYYDSGDPRPAVDLWPVIEAREIALGFEPELCTSFADLAGLNLNDYAHLWDIGYATPYTTNPNNPTAQLTSYMQQGGALFLLGENIYFQPRDTTIDDFVMGLGGGTVSQTTNPAYYNSIPCVVQPEFLLANTNNSITFNAPGAFDNWGTGTTIAVSTSPGLPLPTAICWKTGSLSGAPAGAIVSVLDINFLVIPDINQNFIDNISLILNKK